MKLTNNDAENSSHHPKVIGMALNQSQVLQRIVIDDPSSYILRSFVDDEGELWVEDKAVSETKNVRQKSDKTAFFDSSQASEIDLTRSVDGVQYKQFQHLPQIAKRYYIALLDD